MLNVRFMKKAVEERDITIAHFLLSDGKWNQEMLWKYLMMFSAVLI